MHSFSKHNGKKELHRQKVREFISANYSPDRIKNMRILCLPGRDLIEVEQIWDKLGVRGSNITAAEIRCDFAARMREKNKERAGAGLEPVDIYNGDISDLLASSHTQWDGIFLDLYSNFSRKWSAAICSIARNRLIKPDGFFMINLLARRENLDRQIDYLDSVQSTDDIAHTFSGKGEEEALVALAEHFSRYKTDRRQLAEQLDIKSTRDAIFTAHILKSFFYLPMTSSDLFFSPFMKKKADELVNMYQKIDAIAGGEFLDMVSYDSKQSNPEGLFLHITVTLFHVLKSLFEKAGLLGFFPAISLKLFRPYVLAASERYSYGPNRNNTMISDFCTFKPIPEELLSCAYPLVLSNPSKPNDLVISFGSNEDEMAMTELILEECRQFSDSALEAIHSIGSVFQSRHVL